MSASNVSGKVLSLGLAQGHNTCIMLIVSISIQVMLVSTVVHESTECKVILKCTKDNQPPKWSESYDDVGCSDEQVMSVTGVQVYLKKDNQIFRKFVGFFLISARRRPRNKSTTEKINEDTNGDNENEDKHTTEGVTSKSTRAWSTTAKITTAKITTAKITTAKITTAKITTAKSTTAKSTTAKITTAKITTAKSTTAKSTTAKITTAKSTTAKSTTDTGATSTDNKVTNENMNNDTDSTDMKVIIIVAVSVVAVVATVIAVTLCLLVFCCQKSPLYRRCSIFRRDPQQQCQGEYDYVDESTIQDLIPSPEDSARHGGVLCLRSQDGTASRAYQTTLTSDYEHCDGFSSNESPASTSRTTPSSQPNLAVTIIPVKAKLLKTASSNPGSPQLVDKFSTHETRGGNGENGVSGRYGYLTTEDPQHGIYSLASPLTSSAGAGPATSFNVLSVAGDYAHLTRSGEAPQAAMDNVYDG